MADAQVKTQDTKDQSAQQDAKAIVADIKAIPLSATEKADVEKTFAEAKDFR
jgi:hypothetical protein